MGMFDEVLFRCPNCDGGIVVQTKAGDCILEEYDPRGVPPPIAADIHGEPVCCRECGESFEVDAGFAAVIRCDLVPQSRGR